MMRAFLRWSIVLAGLVLVGIAATRVEAGTVVRFQTNYSVTTTAGTLNYFDVELYDSATPITVENFLKYVNGELYNNTIFHRNMPDFVVQGGGFTPVESGGLITALNPITNFGTIQNEFSSSRSNVTGTVAMAKIPDNPNGASNEWFVNVVDNTHLDTQNGGFTAFGRVLGDGMTLINAINNLPTEDISGFFGGTFTDVPLINDGTEFVRIKSAAALSLSAFSGRAYVDTNHDGVVDGNDHAIAEAKVSLMPSGSSTPVATAYTAADGTYQFDNLAAGTYSLKMETSSGLGLDNGDQRLVVERDGTVVSTGTAGTAALNAYDNTTLGGSQRGLNFDFAQSAYPVDLMSARMLLNTSPGVSQIAATSSALSALAADATGQQAAGAEAAGLSADDGGSLGGSGDVVVSAGGVNAVPEPGTWALLVVGGVFAGRRGVAPQVGPFRRNGPELP